jgi:hypothetical protein
MRTEPPLGSTLTGRLDGGDDRLADREDPSRVTGDVAVRLADGGEAIADLGICRDQPWHTEDVPRDVSSALRDR